MQPKAKKRRLKVLVGTLALAAFFMSAHGFSQDAEAAKKRNESRWFLQNVCMANATKILGRADWVDFDKEAKAARKRLRKRGVPEPHLREMEGFATKIIKSTTTAENAHKGPQLCVQWYST